MNTDHSTRLEPSKHDMPSVTSSLEEYHKALNYLMQHKERHIFQNHSAEHASIIYQVFFESAKKEIKIFCQKLAKEVFGQQKLVTALQGAVARGVKIEIISELKPEKSDFLNTIIEACQSQEESEEKTIYIKTFNTDVADFNFSVVDGVAYRWEEDNKTPTAVGSMFAPKTCNRLLEFFDGTLKNNTELAPVTNQ